MRPLIRTIPHSRRRLLRPPSVARRLLCFSSSTIIPSPSPPAPPIDAGSSIRKPISLWPGMYHSPVTNALWEARSHMFERVGGEDSDAADLSAPKSPSRSRTSIVYRFSEDFMLREQYRNPWNAIRAGKLLEDLDALAGTICFKSMLNPPLLTSALHKREWSDEASDIGNCFRGQDLCEETNPVDTDLKIEGAVTWVGRSSMEIQLEVSQSTPESMDRFDSVVLTANFTFVARDSETGKSAPVTPISPETEREKMLWEEAEERNKLRKSMREACGQYIVSEEMTRRIQELLAEGRVFNDMPALADRDSILIKDTCFQNSLICQPQQRNIHGRIFGGFLMRRAFELAYSTAYAFSGAAPCFLEVDHVDFLKPVDVGNFLHLKSCVLYTELDDPAQPLINVEVVAHVMRPELRSSKVSNRFYFTFTVRPEALTDGSQIRKVVPSTEEEARRVIERMDAENPQRTQQ